MCSRSQSPTPKLGCSVNDTEAQTLSQNQTDIVISLPQDFRLTTVEPKAGVCGQGSYTVEGRPAGTGQILVEGVPAGERENTTGE